MFQRIKLAIVSPFAIARIVFEEGAGIALARSGNGPSAGPETDGA